MPRVSNWIPEGLGEIHGYRFQVVSEAPGIWQVLDAYLSKPNSNTITHNVNPKSLKHLRVTILCAKRLTLNGRHSPSPDGDKPGTFWLRAGEG